MVKIKLFYDMAGRSGKKPCNKCVIFIISVIFNVHLNTETLLGLISQDGEWHGLTSHGGCMLRVENSFYGNDTMSK